MESEGLSIKDKDFEEYRTAYDEALRRERIVAVIRDADRMTIERKIVF